MSTNSPIPTSGIRVIIVGAGFAGLTAAIECHRKGHAVILLESFPDPKPLGDVISFSSNSGHIIARWPGVDEKLEKIIHHSDGISMKTYQGDFLCKQTWTEEQRRYGKSYNGHRGEIHDIFYKHALELGIDIRLDHKVEDYFETESEAGVVVNGKRIVGDVVLAAEGVRSKGRTIVLGYDDKPKSSGYAIYRAWFDAEELEKDPVTAWWFNQGGDRHCAWLGPDVHFIAASFQNGKRLSWVLTHKDDADVKEGWQTLGSLSDAAKVVSGWDPEVLKIISATPSVIDWKLVYRDPLPTWISPKRRIALIGDAAHPFLPTSIQGASQAMEDGACIAVCISRAGKGRVTEGIAAFEALRYQRVAAAQKTGEQTRDMWHKADWEEVKKNPESMKLKREAWLLGHDAEMFAEENYDKVVEKIKERDGIIPRMPLAAGPVPVSTLA